MVQRECGEDVVQKVDIWISFPGEEIDVSVRSQDVLLYHVGYVFQVISNATLESCDNHDNSSKATRVEVYSYLEYDLHPRPLEPFVFCDFLLHVLYPLTPCQIRRVDSQ